MSEALTLFLVTIALPMLVTLTMVVLILRTARRPHRYWYQPRHRASGPSTSQQVKAWTPPLQPDLWLEGVT